MTSSLEAKESRLARGRNLKMVFEFYSAFSEGPAAVPV